MSQINKKQSLEKKGYSVRDIESMTEVSFSSVARICREAKISQI